MQIPEGPRPEVHWRIHKSGETSPYKVLVALFLRENFLHAGGDVKKLVGGSKERVSNLILMYSLISSGDLSYEKFMELILDPKNQIRPEVISKFVKIIGEMDENNPSFLYDLVNSILDMEGAHPIILRKKIGRNSPIGKFLRIVLLNLKKMSFPQSLHLYSQFIQYIRSDKVSIKPKFVVFEDKAEDSEGSKMETSFEKEDEGGSEKDEDSKEKVLKEMNDLYKNGIEKKEAAPKRRSLDIFLKMMEKRKGTNKVGLSLDIHHQFNLTQLEYNNQLTPELKSGFEKALKAKNKRIEKANIAVINLENSWRIPDRESDPELEKPLESPRTKRIRSKIKIPAKKSPRKSSSVSKDENFQIIHENEGGYAPSDDEVECPTKSRRGKQKRSIGDLPVGQARGCKIECDLVKNWSKRQIERTLKEISLSLTQMNCNSEMYTPASISALLDALKFNPSSIVWLPQIQYIEFVNSLRIKDIQKCTESLRTSFDLRIKPHTAELNKGIPYGAYNFAVFYKILGYNEDAMMFLEEAFRSGHNSGDATCLHYCHNLWSHFHQKPYIEAIATETKEVDKNMAYLHSLNVIANSYELHIRGKSPEEILFSLWHYNGECDIEEIEASLLLSLSSFFSVFGWNQLITVPCNIVLNSTLRWPKKIYCGCLCLLAQTILLNGNSQLSSAIMAIGDKLFGIEASETGELFTRENAYFKALTSNLSYSPVDEDCIATIGSFDLNQAFYWRAYNKTILNDWDEAAKLLKRLNHLLRNETVIVKQDLKMRCLLLQAEIECLYRNYQGALCFLFEAVELSKKLHSDSYLSLCLINIASIQTHLGYFKNAARTLHDDMRGLIRSSCLYLDTRMNLANIRLRMEFDQPKLNSADYKNFEELLERAQVTYKTWGNEYRLKEVLWIRNRLLEKKETLDEARGGGAGDACSSSEKPVEFDSIQPLLYWSPSTCLI